MKESALAERIRKVALLQGSFTLRSGQHATEYFDKYRFESDPRLLDEIALAMLPLIPEETEVLAGLELGGVPIATMLSHYSGIPAAFVRKTAKSYGTMRLAEGAEIRGKSVTIVEDVITSGGQVVLSATALRECGANVRAALCVIDREEGGEATLRSAQLVMRPLFHRRDFH